MGGLALRYHPDYIYRVSLNDSWPFFLPHLVHCGAGFVIETDNQTIIQSPAVNTDNKKCKIWLGFCTK